MSTPFALSPMQAGMLFQSLLADRPGASAGFDLEQLQIRLDEEIDPDRLGAAWTAIARRHAALAAAFEWEGVPRPEQRVVADVTVPVEVVDWRAVAEADRPGHLAAFLEKDRHRGFDLRRAPLIRLTVLRTAPGRDEVIWSFHHILIDGRSFAQVLDEAFRAYRALGTGGTPPLPPAGRPFADYVHWRDAQDAAPGLAFFRALLEGKHTPTALPCSEPAARPLPREGAGEHLLAVAPETRASVRALAEATGTTVGTVIHAAWALTLSRLTAEQDVVFGTIRACRRSALGGDAERMVGMFINTLPMRVRLPDTATVRELLEQVRQQGVSVRAHEHASLAEIQAASGLPPGTALFDTLLMFDNRRLDRVLCERDPEWSRRSTRLHERPSPPLTLTVTDDEQLELRLLYSRARFKDGAAVRIARYLESALAALAASASRPVRELEILPDDERRRIVDEWNHTARPFPDRLLIHQPFEARVDVEPDATAVECSGKSLRYAELETRANRLAHLLRGRGARPGTYVGLCLDRGLDLVTALLAIAKSGAAYVPMDPEYPPDRLAFMQEDARALFTVAHARHRERLTGQLVVVDGADEAEIGRQPGERLPPTAKPTDVCYAIYTSGSTGKPKGVVLTHRAVVNTFDWVTRTFEVVPGDRLLFVTSPCFDLSVYDTFGALGAGATVVVAAAEQLDDPQALAAALVEQRITIWDSAPAALQRLVTFFPKSSRGAPLRLAMLSGDWIPLSLPGAVRAAFPRAKVKSLGGATEAAIWSNWFPVEELDPRWTSVPYGFPIQNARYHVLDARMRPAAIGVAGDLYIGGTPLAEGYLNREELTRERFVPDPFKPGERLYKTGDLARYFDDGALEFLGRADFQVKIRGFRVELGEVEAVLAAVPAVREVVCAAWADSAGQKSLVAYVVLQDGASVKEAELKSQVGQRLPDFMVPSQVVVLARMPLSSNGKVDRKALPSPTARSADVAYVPPRNELERKMAALWQELLRKDQVGITDDFFALGGHSLIAVMLVSRAKSELGLDLPLGRFLEHPTIEGLIAVKAASAGPSRHLVTLTASAERPPLVLCSGIGGFGFVFHGLTKYFGPSQPLHILNAIGAQDERDGFDHSIEQMAEIYEPQVLAVCPEGPVALGGYSFGMLVAYELAHRLRARGRPVPLLVSFDGYAPGFPKLMALPARVFSHLKTFFSSDAAGRRDYLRERIRAVRSRVYERQGRHEETVRPIPNADEDTDRRLRRVTAGLWRARGVYAPEHRDPADLLLVKTSISDWWIGNQMDDPLYGWKEFIRGEIQVETVAGEHLAMFEPANQQQMVSVVSAAIARRFEGA